MSRCCYGYTTRYGRVVIAENGRGITRVFFGSPSSLFRHEEKESPLLKEAAAQLAAYFGGERQDFSLPLAPEGTSFQHDVWRTVRGIPYGETRSYRDIAIETGNGKASRAVGKANGGNPLLFLIPCHRVIGSDGSLTGYAGGLPLKKQLLLMERTVCAA